MRPPNLCRCIGEEVQPLPSYHSPYISHRHGKPNKEYLESPRVSHHIEIIQIEANDEETNPERHQQVDRPRSPLRQVMQFARAFVLIILVQTLQGIVQFPADFAAG